MLLVCGQEEGKEKDEADKLDALKQELKRRQKEASQYILNAGKLIAPVSQSDSQSDGQTHRQQGQRARTPVTRSSTTTVTPPTE